MKNFLKKYGLVIGMGIVIGFLSWNGYWSKDVGSISKAKNTLALENLKLNTAIQKSRESETQLQQEINSKAERIKEMDKELIKTRMAYDELKGKLASLQPPEEPESFVALEECQKKYASLATHLNICLAAAEKGDEALTLCLDKTEQQKKLLHLQETTYLECQLQVQLTEQKRIETEKAKASMERIYKRKLFAKDTIIYMVGIAASITAGYLLLKRK